MKTRQGLVSNSSSSSYIITIQNISWDSFCSRLLEEYGFYDFFDINYIVHQLEEKIKSKKEDILKEDKTKSLHKWIEDQIKFYEEQKKKLDKLIKKDVHEEIIKAILDYHGIKHNVNNLDLKLEYFTAMHNSYNEGICDILKEILLFFAFEDDVVMNFERIAD